MAQDTRWLRIGMLMAEAHKRAGEWLRGVKMPNGMRVKLAEGHLHPCFVGLAENLRAGHRKAEEFRTRATGRVGMILPGIRPGPRRGRASGWLPQAVEVSLSRLGPHDR